MDGLNIKMEVPDLPLPDQLGEDGLGFGNGLFLGDADDDDDTIVVHMDLRENLSTLRGLVEQRIGMSLKHYEFWLQDTQMLESHKNLVDQCVQGEGLVQINVQVQTSRRRINIADVLKPTDDVLESYQQELQLAAAQAAAAAAAASISGPNAEATTSILANAEAKCGESGRLSAHGRRYGTDQSPAKVAKMSPPELADSPTIIDDDDYEDEMGDGGQAALRWACDTNFKAATSSGSSIPDDPESSGRVAQVKHWIQWAVRTLQPGRSIKPADWSNSGARELKKRDNGPRQSSSRRCRKRSGRSVLDAQLELLRRSASLWAAVQLASAGWGYGFRSCAEAEEEVAADPCMTTIWSYSRKVPRNNSMGSGAQLLRQPESGKQWPDPAVGGAGATRHRCKEHRWNYPVDGFYRRRVQAVQSGAGGPAVAANGKNKPTMNPREAGRGRCVTTDDGT
ncbi:hypothetical protein quinque_012283 [Culex quinquefasciatus]